MSTTWDKVGMQEYKDIIDLRKEAALYLIKQINCNEVMKELWHEVHLHSLFPSKAVKKICDEDSCTPKIQPCSDLIESDCLSSECLSFEKYPEKRFDVDVAVVSLNQLMSITFNEYKFTESETVKLESESIGIVTNLLPDSGYGSENLKNLCDIVESLYNYVITSSYTPCTANDKYIKKSMASINEAACTHSEVTRKVIDLVENTLVKLIKFSTLENEDLKTYSNFGNVLRVIQKICYANENITLHKITIIITEIIVNNEELVKKINYHKLSKVFYLISSLRDILNDYESQTKKESKMVKSNMLQRVSVLKNLKKTCDENLKLLRKYWFMSPVALNFQRCVSCICDIIKLQTVKMK